MKTEIPKLEHSLNKLNDYKNSPYFFNIFLHQKGYIWGELQDISFTGSALKNLFKSLNSFSTNVVLLLTLTKFINLKTATITITSTSLLNSVFQVIDTAYITYFQRKSLKYFSFSLGNFLFWASRAVILASKYGYIPSSDLISKSTYWVGLVSNIPIFLLGGAYISMFFSRKINNLLQNKIYYDLSNPIDAMFEVPTFLAFDQLSGLNQYQIPGLICNSFLCFPLFGLSGIIFYNTSVIYSLCVHDKEDDDIEYGLWLFVSLAGMLGLGVAYCGVKGLFVDELYTLLEERKWMKILKLFSATICSGYSALGFWISFYQSRKINDC